MSELSERLRALRGPTSQAEMARQLGMKQPQWARYESGASTPSVEVLAAICRIHAVSADWLLGIDRAAALNVSAGAGSAVAIGANARATARNSPAPARIASPGEDPACRNCPHLKKLKKLEALLAK